MTRGTQVLMTGAFSGLGRGIAECLSTEGLEVVGIGRDSGRRLSSPGVSQAIEWDLSVPRAGVSALRSWLDVSSMPFYLLLCAATIDPLGPLGTLNIDEVERSVNVNFVSQTLILNECLKPIRGSRLLVGVAFVNSGAASNPIRGWGMYCAGKAATQMLIQCVRQEQPQLPIFIRDPGVVDTPMQNRLRATGFDLPLNGFGLRDPQIAAEALVRDFLNEMGN